MLMKFYFEYFEYILFLCHILNLNNQQFCSVALIHAQFYFTVFVCDWTEFVWVGFFSSSYCCVVATLIHFLVLDYFNMPGGREYFANGTSRNILKWKTFGKQRKWINIAHVRQRSNNLLLLWNCIREATLDKHFGSFKNSFCIALKNFVYYLKKERER